MYSVVISRDKFALFFLCDSSPSCESVGYLRFLPADLQRYEKWGQNYVVAQISTKYAYLCFFTVHIASKALHIGKFGILKCTTEWVGSFESLGSMSVENKICNTWSFFFISLQVLNLFSSLQYLTCIQSSELTCWLSTMTFTWLSIELTYRKACFYMSFHYHSSYIT